MSSYHWKVINDKSIAFFIHNVLHYTVDFDQHDIITAIHFEGGISINMDEPVHIGNDTYMIEGVRDIIKIDATDTSNVAEILLSLHPFNMEVRFDAFVLKK